MATAADLSVGRDHQDQLPFPQDAILLKTLRERDHITKMLSFISVKSWQTRRMSCA
jgi:hypothetical protein